MSLQCPSCSAKDLDDDYSFCPYCGFELSEPPLCPKCGYQADADTNFCPKCGTPLHEPKTPRSKRHQVAAKPTAEAVEVEPPPDQGVTIEFLHSTSASYHFAREVAQRFPTYRQYGEGKKAVHRITLAHEEMDAAMELVEYVKGWRRRAVYVNGEKVPWNSVFQFVWCYESRKSSFRPEFYCFGYENVHQLNPWGCLQAHLPFADHAEWFTWGRWLGKKGDWEFDKQRIRHELQKNLYAHRFCPAIRLEFVEHVLLALPDRVNPNRDKDWKFVETWDENAPGLVVKVKRYGFEEKTVMVGVAPSGPGALQKLAQKVDGLRLPPPLT